MPIEQVAFEVPKQIANKIDAGEYIRFGGVVRDKAGHIVAHLKEVVPKRIASKVRINPQAPDSKFLRAVNDFAVKNKKVIIIGAVAMLVSGGAVAIYKHFNKKKIREIVENSDQTKKVEEMANSYDIALNDYYKAIQLKTTNYDVINKLKTEFEKIRKGINEEDISFDVPAKDLKSLATVIQGYGAEFRKANNLPESPLVDLTDYDIKQLIDFIIIKLEEQEQVFTINLAELQSEKVLA